MNVFQSQSLKQDQRLSTKQIQLFKILALPSNELEQYISNEMAANPALEYEESVSIEDSENEYKDEVEDDFNDYDDFSSEAKLGEDYDYTDYMDKDSLDNYKFEVNNTSPEESKTERLIVGSTHFTELLIGQYFVLAPSTREEELGSYLIHSLDEDGYLRTSLAELADEISFKNGLLVEEQELEAILVKIQTLEPCGVGARNLQECLLIQLLNKKRKTVSTRAAISIVQDFMESLAEGKHNRIQEALELDEELYENALQEIKLLNPKPAGSSSQANNIATAIIPDFTIQANGDEVELFLNQAKQPSLKISAEYTQMLGEYANAKNKELKEASAFIKDKVDAAKWFIEALQQRESMMVMVAKAIVAHQQAYFISGDTQDLKPMILKDVADKIGAHISTVSRIANSKYIATPFATILIKDLFVQGLSNKDGDVISTHEIKQAIMQCINDENKCKPLTDDEIAATLAQQKYNLSRRTVAKYRDELNIPNKSLRKAA